MNPAETDGRRAAPLVWFTRNGRVVPNQRLRKHLYDTFVDENVQKMIWNMIFLSAQGGTNFTRLVERCRDEGPQPDEGVLVDYLQSLIDAGYQSHGICVSSMLSLGTTVRDGSDSE